jgi:hypothetical protein
MARTKVSGPKYVVERNFALTGELMRYLLEHPQVFESLPDNFLMTIQKCACITWNCWMPMGAKVSRFCSLGFNPAEKAS